jgi:hypothetical protein
LVSRATPATLRACSTLVTPHAFCKSRLR